MQRGGGCAADGKLGDYRCRIRGAWHAAPSGGPQFALLPSTWGRKGGVLLCASLAADLGEGA